MQVVELAYILIAISAIAKAVMDHCKINTFPYSWTWWNEETGWLNKYKDNMIGFIENNSTTHDGNLFKYGILYDSNPREPRFFGSTTFLVWVTDGWHFFQMIYLNCLMIGFWLLPKEWWILLICLVGFKVIFQGAYSLIKTIF